MVAAAGATVAASVYCLGVSSGGDGGAGGGGCGEAGVPRRQGRRWGLRAVTVAAVTAPSEETSPAAAGRDQQHGGTADGGCEGANSGMSGLPRRGRKTWWSVWGHSGVTTCS